MSSLFAPLLSSSSSLFRSTINRNLKTEYAKIIMMMRDTQTISRTNKIPFPAKVYRMLEDTEAKGLAWIVSWDRTGRAFRVHRPSAFVKDVMPIYFRQTKYKSFTRQLNLYGFQRVTNEDLDQCGYYFHERFRRGDEMAAWDHIQPLRKLQKGQEVKSKPSESPFTTSVLPPGANGAPSVGEVNTVSNLYQLLLPQSAAAGSSENTQTQMLSADAAASNATADIAARASEILSRVDQMSFLTNAAATPDAPSVPGLFFLQSQMCASLQATSASNHASNASDVSKPDMAPVASSTVQLQTEGSFSSSSPHTIPHTSEEKTLTDLCSLTKFEFPQNFDFALLEPAPLGNDCKSV